MNLFKSLSNIFIALGLLSGLAVADETPPDEPQPEEKKFYKKYAPDGQVIYTDRPDTTTEEIKVPKGTTYTPVKIPDFTTHKSKQKPDVFKYTRLQITKPLGDSVNWSNTGLLEVAVELEPALRSGHKLVYLFDSNMAKEGTETSVTLTDISPGTHKLRVEVHDKSGKSIQATSVIYHQKRHLPKKKITPPTP